jgi:uncharacterized protein YlxW (UPF0749 family)
MKVFSWFKVVWTWIKGHWGLLVAFLVMVMAAVVAKNKTQVVERLLKELREQQTQNTKDLDQLRQVQKEQIDKQQEINRKYNEVMDTIQRDYQEQLRTLDIQKEIDLRHIISTNKDDPAAMARDINVLFGIPIYPTAERNRE